MSDGCRNPSECLTDILKLKQASENFDTDVGVKRSRRTLKTVGSLQHLAVTVFRYQANPVVLLRFRNGDAGVNGSVPPQAVQVRPLRFDRIAT